MELKIYKSDDKVSFANEEEVSILQNYKLIEFHPKFFNLSYDNTDLIKNFLWVLLTRGNYTILYLIINNTVTHTSYIIPKNPRFPFMKSGDLQVGPCFTYPESRNKGIYTSVLKHILKRYSLQGRTIWIYTTFQNLASQKAIERAGFYYAGVAVRKGLLKTIRLRNQ